MHNQLFQRQEVKFERCVVCWEDCLENLCSLKCGHVFHEFCVQSWCEKQAQCPICKKVVVKNDMRKLIYKVYIDLVDLTSYFQDYFDCSKNFRLENILVIQKERKLKFKIGVRRI